MVKSFLSVKKHVKTIMSMRWVFVPLQQQWKKLKMRFVKATDQRKLTRYRCQIEASMVIGRLASIEGRIKDMSIGGCLIRPASFFLVDRISEKVTLELGSYVLEGKVVRTLPIGYALQFNDMIEEDLLQDILKLSDTTATEFNKSQEDETRETKEKAKKAA